MHHTFHFAWFDQPTNYGCPDYTTLSSLPIILPSLGQIFSLATYTASHSFPFCPSLMVMLPYKCTVKNTVYIILRAFNGERNLKDSLNYTFVEKLILFRWGLGLHSGYQTSSFIYLPLHLLTGTLPYYRLTQAKKRLKFPLNIVELFNWTAVEMEIMWDTTHLWILVTCV